MGKNTDPDSVHSLNHSKCMLAAFQNFRQDETMLDVTLVCNGKSLKAHKLVLSSCSDFFKELFSENPCKHPIVILRHFEFDDLKAVIDFIYKGELSVPRERLMSALKIAADLNIRGLISSGNNKGKYEKLYNQFCKKQSNRKKRKRQRYHSTDSEEKYIKVSDSDQNAESDGHNVASSEPQAMDVESVYPVENLIDDKDVRPLVLHVGDLATNDEKSISNLQMDEEDCNKDKKNFEVDIPIEGSSILLKEDPAAEIYEAATENIELSSQFDSYVTCTENSNQPDVPGYEQSNSQDKSMEAEPSTEDSEKQSSFVSVLSPESIPEQQNKETGLSNEGKRFICSKCDSVFTSRINFMRHKALGHNNREKSCYECQYCTFTSEDVECLNKHVITHTDSVPYKCSTCSEEFTSEEVYQKHISLHEVEEIALHGFSAVAEQDVFSTSNKSAKDLEFRCSICFIKFSSKLRCQIHEKTCQGDS